MDAQQLLNQYSAIIIPLVITGVVWPWALSLMRGLLRKANNTRQHRPTYRPGQIFRQCYTPDGGRYPIMMCVHNGLSGVLFKVGNNNGDWFGMVYIKNSRLPNWVMPWSEEVQ